MKVITTKESFEKKINLKGLGVLPEGIILDLPEERAKELMGNNAYKLHFVKSFGSKPVEVEVKEEPKKETKEEVKEEPVKEEKPVKKAKNKK